MKNRIINIVSVFLSLVVILVDFFREKELMQEDTYCLMLVVELSVFIQTQFMDNRVYKVVGATFMFGITILNILPLFWTWFGFGFTGRAMSANLILCMFMNFVMMVLSVLQWNKLK